MSKILGKGPKGCSRRLAILDKRDFASAVSPIVTFPFASITLLTDNRFPLASITLLTDNRLHSHLPPKVSPMQSNRTSHPQHPYMLSDMIVADSHC